MLGEFIIADDGMRNVDAWVAWGQSLDFMFSQHTHGSSILTSDVPKGLVCCHKQPKIKPIILKIYIVV